jgi:hypothetical protein
MELALCSSNLGNIDVEVADGIRLELLLWGLVALDLWQPFNTMSLKAAMQWRACQLRNCRLQGIEATIQRHKRAAPEGGGHSFLFKCQDRRTRLLGAGLMV